MPAEAGHEAAVGQPNRPADLEIHGDPRTHEDEWYPDEAKVSDEDQRPIGERPDLDEENAP